MVVTVVTVVVTVVVVVDAATSSATLGTEDFHHTDHRGPASLSTILIFSLQVHVCVLGVLYLKDRLQW